MYDIVDTTTIIEDTFQSRVYKWLQYAFGGLYPKIIDSKRERNHRFLEESLELVQACGLVEVEAMELVHYVYNRPIGEIHQEVGGVAVTLAALCEVHGISTSEAAETELSRAYAKVAMIRTKQTTKPTFDTQEHQHD
jgi:hypothetical protein